MSKKQNKALKSENGRELTGLAPLSLLIFLLDKLTDWVYRSFGNGFFGKIFTSYSAEQRAFERGAFKNYFVSAKFRRNFRKVRLYVSRSFEESFFLNWIKKHVSSMLTVPLKSYGGALFSFGIYTVLIYFLRWILPQLPEAGLDFVWVGVACCIVSIPLLLSYDSLATAIGKGVLTRFLFRDTFGFRDEHMEMKASVSRTKNHFLIFGGMLCGMLTLFVHPLNIVLGLFAVLGIILIVASPEIGVFLSIFCLPFFSIFENATICLGLLIFITNISYLVKLVRGKRILKIELLDLSVIFFMILLFLSGTLSAGGTMGFLEVMICCDLMLGYFLVVNLMRTEAWLNRSAFALVASGTVVSWIGIAQYALGALGSVTWLDTSYFPDIKGRVTSLYENPNVLAVYLVMILPFTLLLALRSNTWKEKLLCSISFLSALLCILFTWSRGAWIAAIVSMLLFALVYNKKTVRFLCLIGFLTPFLTILLPQTVMKRLTSIGDLADSSTMYRVYTWKGTLRAIGEHFMGGIGYGNVAYREIYPQYAYAGIEAAEHSHSLFLQILLGMGIGGLVVFLVVLLLSAQMNLEYLKCSKNRELKLMVLTCICAVVATLVMGLFDFIWYNYRIFFLFWVVLALSCACVRVGNAEQMRHSVSSASQSTDATLDLNLQ